MDITVSIQNFSARRIESTDDEREAIRYARTRFKVGAYYFVPALMRNCAVDPNHTRAYDVMKEEGLLYSKANSTSGGYG